MHDEIDALLVAAVPPVAVVRVRGRGTFKLAPALKRFGAAALAAGCTRLILDMDRCVGMDSTFMGVTGGLALRFKKEAGGELAVARLSVKNKTLLTTLGLDRCVRMEGADQDLDAFSGEPQAAAAAEPADRATMTRTMLDAHETLAAISEENRAKFKDVLTYLQEETAREREGTERRG